MASTILLFLGTYLCSVLIHVAPLSAASYKLRNVTDRVIQPYFRQKWTLFAPTPPRRETHDLVQVRCVVKSSSAPSNGVQTSDFVDVSRFVNDLSRSSLIFPSRINRALGKVDDAVVVIQGPAYNALRQEALFNPQVTEKNLSAFAEKQVAIYSPIFRRFASAAAERSGLIDRCANPNLAEVRGLVVDQPIPEFRDRFIVKQPPKFIRYDSGWYRYEHISVWR